MVRNDQITLEEIARLEPEKIVISPGPCTPDKAGISVDLVRRFAGETPILGVCLGHQALAVAFGGAIVKAGRIMHGKISLIHHDGQRIFKNLPNPFKATRYHSLGVSRKSLPDCFVVTAESEDGEIMGLRHKEEFLEGVQFHPESILTPSGKELLKNFLELPVPA